MARHDVGGEGEKIGVRVGFRHSLLFLMQQYMLGHGNVGIVQTLSASG
jgi:hypothetical protein